MSVMTRKDMQAVLVGEPLTISSFWVGQGLIMTGLSNQAIRCPLCPVVKGGPKLVFQRRPPPAPEEGRVSHGHVAESFLKGPAWVGEIFSVYSSHTDPEILLHFLSGPKPAMMCHVICPRQRKISLWLLTV